MKQAIPPRFSEDALALRFTTQYASDLRYVARWGHWLRWDGIRWAQDSTLHVFDLARAVCREASAECKKEATATRLASKATGAAVERLAEADRHHAATVEQWDRNPMLLNTPAGTVDLTTGELRAHSREDFITKVTAAAPGRDCPLWLSFLERVTAGDGALQGFLQRMAGYAITGLTREHALFFLYGTGANGKSVFINTLSGVMGEYARTAPIEAFIASNNEHHPTDLAGLQGARLVTAIETEDGRRWAESKLKALTGGDRIAARFMRQDYFEYSPQFKLVIAGNHKPGLRTVDEAIRRRFNLLPFTVTIPKVERDELLTEKLAAESPGILTWAIQGCLAWQSQGLNQPDSVRAATDEYMAAEDRIGTWLQEECVIDPRCSSASSALFANYKAWCERRGEREGSQRRFSQALEDRRFKSEHTRRGTAFIGVALREDTSEFGADDRNR